MRAMKKTTRKKPRPGKKQPAVTQTGGKGEIVIYQPAEGGGRMDVRLHGETLWLSLNQISGLFERDKSVVSRHLRNVFKEGELDRGSTVAFFATVQNEGERLVERQVEYFNLDAILSVGYRVNSRRGTQFRIWATQVLRDHLVKGYSVNARRLAELQQSLKLVGQVLEHYDVTSDQAKGLLRVVTDYASALDLLDDYDHQRVSLPPLTRQAARSIDYDEAMKIIAQLRRRFGGSDLFGKEKDRSLRGSLGAVVQTFDRRRPLPEPAGEGGAPPVLPGQEPQLRGWEQAHRRGVVPVVHGEERHPLPDGRVPPYRRQRTGRHHAHDRGERPEPEGEPDAGSGKSHQIAGRPANVSVKESWRLWIRRQPPDSVTPAQAVP